MSSVYIRLIKDMYEGGRTSVRTPGGLINDSTLVWASIRVPL